MSSNSIANRILISFDTTLRRCAVEASRLRRFHENLIQ
jgi:hypothetical protein